MKHVHRLAGTFGLSRPASSFRIALLLGFGLVATAILLTRATIFEAIFMFPLVMLIPGVALAEFMIPTASPDEVLAMGFGLMVAISGLLSLLHELPSAYGTLSIGIATMVLLVFSAWRFMRSRLVSKISSADKFGLYCMLAAFFLAISIVLLPVHEGDVLFLMAPPYHTRMPFLPGDMVLPYRFAQFLVNHLDVYSTTFYCCDWHIYDRTPLMGMVGAYLLGLFRIDVVAAPVFWGASQQVLDKSGLYEFWSAGALLDASIILSGYLLIKTLFGQKVARLATVFLVLNPFILWNAFYTSPKSMAAYFVLLFYYCVVTRRHLPLAGVFAGLAVLSHAYALLFLPGGLLFLIMGHGSEIRKIPRMLALFVAVVAPWGLWAYALHTELGLFFRMLAGPSDLTAAVWTRIVNAYRTLSPWLFGLTASDTSNFFASQPTISADIRSHPILALVGLTYVWTLPGAVSLSLTTFSFAGLFGESRSKSRLVLLLVVLPFVFGVAITGGVYGGLAYVYCHPIVPILVAFGAVYLLQHGKKALNAAVGLGILAESLFVTWVMIYPYHLLVRLSSLFDLALLAMILLCYSAILLTLAHVLLESRQSAITYPDTTT